VRVREREGNKGEKWKEMFHISYRGLSANVRIAEKKICSTLQFCHGNVQANIRDWDKLNPNNGFLSTSKVVESDSKVLPLNPTLYFDVSKRNPPL
jgi:hypothetical protein